MTEQEFLLPVIQRNTDRDGKLKDPDLLRRLQHPTCLRCQEEYKKKFPGRPFRIVCQGIAREEDFQKLAQRSGLTLEEIRELEDRVFWAEKYTRLVDEKGDVMPFRARDYQVPVLCCTAQRKVDRMGRGMGKTCLGVIEELHTAITRKNYPILVLCPAKAQAQKWFDDLLWQIENHPGFEGSLVGRRMQPFFQLRFRNGSTISIFTAGSKSGRDADVIRSQSPRRVRLEEQDLLNEGDYKAVMPLLRRYTGSEFHGSSTPTGTRSTFWAMCKSYPDYREFYAPITLHPDWSPEMEEACRREARTTDVYLHEYLAEFGDPAQGVFKAVHIDASRRAYAYDDCHYDKNKKYVMGVDWNGQGTGTRIRVASYDSASKERRIVATRVIDGPATTTQDSLDAIRELNRTWHCAAVYIDAGFGHVQDELLRKIGQDAPDADDRRLLDVKVIDFGASLSFNRLVPKRGNTKYRQEEELERRTKPFMVEGAVMILEQGLFAFSDKDEILDAQLRAYRVKTWSQHGFANTYAAGSVGDHDLDATMLALLGIEMEYGLFRTVTPQQRLARLRHVAGFGQAAPIDRLQQVVETRQEVEQASQVPSRLGPLEPASNLRLHYISRHGLVVSRAVPGDGRHRRAPSRTAPFRSPRRPRERR